MTKDADFKALVRARMSETGEPYTAAREVVLAEHAQAQAHWDKTVRSFFDGERLRSIPVKRRARVVVLLVLLRRFEPGRDYPEREVNEILNGAHGDHAYLRRELVDYGYLVRADGIYRVADSLPDRDARVVAEPPVDEAARFRAATRG